MSGTTQPGTASCARLRRLLDFCFLPVFVFLAVRLFAMIDRYAVNILFLDQWDYMAGLFSGASAFELFRWQHGPHRQGLGLFITKPLAEWSGWNMRDEAFAIGVVVCVACGLGLWLKRRLAGGFYWGDAAIPLIFLTLLQYGTFFNTPNPSHSALPLALLISLGLVWTVRYRWVRYGGTLLLNVCLVYTGFGIFAGLMVPAFFAMEAIDAFRKRGLAGTLTSVVGFSISVLILSSFFVNYTFEPALKSFSSPARLEWWNYPRFVAILLASFMRLEAVQPAGFLALAGGLWVLGIHAGRLLLDRREDSESRTLSFTIILLLGFSLLYAASIAIARLSVDPIMSRYMTLLSCYYFGLYLHLCSLSGKQRAVSIAVFLVLLVMASGVVHSRTINSIKWFESVKKDWKNTYLATGSIERADEAAGFSLYPNPEATQMHEKLAYLKERQLNLFCPGGK